MFMCVCVCLGASRDSDTRGFYVPFPSHSHSCRAQTAVPDVIMFLAASNRSKVHVTAYRRLVGIVHTEDLKRKRL